LTDRKLKLKDLIGHRPLGRPLEADEIVAEFERIRDAQKDHGRKKDSEGNEVDGKVSSATDFTIVGAKSGTHVLKFNTSRASTAQNVMRFTSPSGEGGGSFVPSTDVNQITAAKIAYRPLEIEGREPKSLVDHVLSPDNLSSIVMEAFAKVYGKEALEGLREGLTERLDPISELPVAECPIIFLPRPGGGDVQVTPVAPAESYTRFYEVTVPYFLKATDDQPSPPRGEWHRQHVSGKPQNISSAAGQRRIRFRARLPIVLRSREAYLYRHAMGGPFPRWEEEFVPPAIERYANLLDREADYSNTDIRAGRERRADALVRAAREYIDDTLEELTARFPDLDKRPVPPKIVPVLLSALRWNSDERNRARRVLTSDHFKSRLKKAGES